MANEEKSPEKEKSSGKLTPKMILAATALALLLFLAPVLTIITGAVFFALKSANKNKVENKDKTFAELLRESQTESKLQIEALERRIEMLLKVNKANEQEQSFAPTNAQVVDQNREQEIAINEAKLKTLETKLSGLTKIQNPRQKAATRLSSRPKNASPRVGQGQGAKPKKPIRR